MLMKTDIAEAVDQIDKFTEIIEERLVCLLVVLHPDILLNMDFYYKIRSTQTIRIIMYQS